MSKSIYEEAIEDLYYVIPIGYPKDMIGKTIQTKRLLDFVKHAEKQEQEHIEYSKKVQEQFSNDTKRIGELESKLIKQEKLLDMYREYFEYSEMLKDGRKFGGRMLVEHERDKLSEEIKELEK